MSKIIYKLFYSFIWLFTAIPFNILYLFSDLFHILLQYIIGYRKKVTYRNLSRSFPDKDKKEIKNIAKKFYSHLCDFGIESLKTIHLSQKQVDKRYKYENAEIFEALFNKNKDVALVSGHYGNWEWMVNFPDKIPYKFLVVYRPLKVKLVDKLIHDIRSKYGAIMIPVKETYKEILKYKQNNQYVILWSLVDQRPPRRNKYWTKFLNQDTSFYTGFEKIAMKLNMAVVFMSVKKLKRGYYNIQFEQLYENTSDLPDFEITNKVVKTLEDSIVKKPEYWLWSHNRWKHKREKTE
jgi:KDO2-lipid IV(A) lauroyltransferase